MDRVEAARELGVAPSSTTRQVERAFRARVRVEHPDRFPPGSEAWEDASSRMMRLTEARRILIAADARRGRGVSPSPPSPSSPSSPDSFVAGTTEAGDRWAWAADAPPQPEDGFLTEAQIDRRRRAWGLGWGAFLVVSAVLSLVVGASQSTNDALPFWAPALAVTGATALTIGWRAHRRLTRG